MIPYEDHLLPPNSSQLERVISAVGARVQAIPVPIDTIKRPFEAPTQFLPHLAFELSVDVWKKGWSETRKRVVIDASLRLHQKKGTAYALREYARYADAEVIKIERPPMKVFSGKSLTRDEREAWLSALPQIRTWRVRETGTASQFKAFYGGRSNVRLRSRRFCLRGAYITPTTALSRLKRRARWVVGGTETDTRVSNVGTTFRLHIKGVEGVSVYSGRPFAPRFYIPSTARLRLITVAPTPRLPWRSAVTPSLQAVVSEPQRVKVAGTRGHSAFCDLPMRGGGAFFVPTTAALRIFERFPVYDGTHMARRPVVQIMGVGRYGFAPHTARVTISIPGKVPPWRAGEGINALRRRYWMPHDPSRLIETRAAIAASMRLSDKVLLKIGPARPFVAGGAPIRADVSSIIVGRA